MRPQPQERRSHQVRRSVCRRRAWCSAVLGIRREGENVVHAPPGGPPPTNGVLRETNSLRPFRVRQGLALVGKEFRRTTIAILLRVGGPNTVFWGVVTIDVFALDGVLGRWLWPHVANEVTIVIPSRADLNASCAVILERAVVGIIAAVPHVYPCFVFGRCFAALTLRSVYSVQTSASAATRIAFDDRKKIQDALFPTIAPALVSEVLIQVRSTLY